MEKASAKRAHVKKMIVDDDGDVSIKPVENNKNREGGGGKTFCFCCWWE